jgi:fatty-acyl-CoA synthase
MAWGFRIMSLVRIKHGAAVFNLQPEAIIKILQEEKITKSKWVSTIWLGVYHAMKENPPKKN